jgi:ferritin-like metal-binding protein YciE
MEMNSFQDLYVEQLRDLYSAETQLCEALPKMAQAASNPELKQSFQMHLQQTERQREDVRRIIENIGEKAEGHECKAMKGLIEEGQEVIQAKRQSDPEVLDAALIAAAQRIEHYEIAGYGTVRTYAQMMGDETAVQTLDRIANEEGETDKKLTRLAETIINPAAMGQDSSRMSNGMNSRM